MIIGIFKKLFFYFFVFNCILNTNVIAQNQFKINGINFTAPDQKINSDWTNPVKSIGANWVSIIPFAFSKSNEPKVYFDGKSQWWGETSEGVSETIKHAKIAGFKVMIKPQIWIHQGGWIGDFDVKNEENWIIWENEYRKYILTYARIAQNEKVEMLCIGTEVRLAVAKRPVFWKNLIMEIRKIYDGKLTYSSNWDDYQKVSFWKELDYIGISAYFPLVDKINPDLKELDKAWQPIIKRLNIFSDLNKKEILFTEFGYRSMNKPAWKSWELEYKEDIVVNTSAQVLAYQALFASFWNQKWMAGGFLWKWYHDHSQVGGAGDTDWTPQNKPVEKVIQHWYSQKEK